MKRNILCACAFVAGFAFVTCSRPARAEDPFAPKPPAFYLALGAASCGWALKDNDSIEDMLATSGACINQGADKLLEAGKAIYEEMIRRKSKQS